MHNNDYNNKNEKLTSMSKMFRRKNVSQRTTHKNGQICNFWLPMKVLTHKKWLPRREGDLRMEKSDKKWDCTFFQTNLHLIYQYQTQKTIFTFGAYK